MFLCSVNVGNSLSQIKSCILSRLNALNSNESCVTVLSSSAPFEAKKDRLQIETDGLQMIFAMTIDFLGACLLWLILLAFLLCAS